MKATVICDFSGDLNGALVTGLYQPHQNRIPTGAMLSPFSYSAGYRALLIYYITMRGNFDLWV